MTEPVAIAVIGAGGWGKNLVRNVATLPGARLAWVCDLSREVRAQTAAAHPGTRCTEAAQAQSLATKALGPPNSYLSRSAARAVGELQLGVVSLGELVRGRGFGTAPEGPRPAVRDRGNTVACAQVLGLESGERLRALALERRIAGASSVERRAC